MAPVAVGSNPIAHPFPLLFCPPLEAKEPYSYRRFEGNSATQLRFPKSPFLEGNRKLDHLQAFRLDRMFQLDFKGVSFGPQAPESDGQECAASPPIEAAGQIPDSSAQDQAGVEIGAPAQSAPSGVPVESAPRRDVA